MSTSIFWTIFCSIYDFSSIHGPIFDIIYQRFWNIYELTCARPQGQIAQVSTWPTFIRLTHFVCQPDQLKSDWYWPVMHLRKFYIQSTIGVESSKVGGTPPPILFDVDDFPGPQNMDSIYSKLRVSLYYWVFFLLH